MLKYIKNNHTLHAIFLGIIVYLLTRNNENAVPLSVAVTIFALLYMHTFGHKLPF